MNNKMKLIKKLDDMSISWQRLLSTTDKPEEKEMVQRQLDILETKKMSVYHSVGQEAGITALCKSLGFLIEENSKTTDLMAAVTISEQLKNPVFYKAFSRRFLNLLKNEQLEDNFKMDNDGIFIPLGDFENENTSAH